MTPDAALASHRTFLAEIGEDIIVRRWTGAVKTEAQIRARVMGYAPQQLVGAVVQGDRRVIAINDPGAAVPSGKVALATLLPLSTDDKLVIRGIETAIKSIDDSTRRIAGVLVALEIQAAG